MDKESTEVTLQKEGIPSSTNLCFVWWNTSLAPAARSRGESNELNYAVAMVRFFIENLNADIVSLCEVSSSEVKKLESELKDLDVEIFNGHIQAGRGYFDTCVIYNRTKLFLLDYTCIEKKKLNRTYRVAQRLDFRINETSSPLHLFISHWPSPINHNQYEDSRRFLGQILRDSIDGFSQGYIESVPIVLMGDYNNEPFDSCISQDLLATRDRAYISKKRELLYNPFWKLLSHKCSYTKDSKGTFTEAGTYFYSQDQSSRWKTFDQMMFSSALLGNSEWHLNESLTSTLELKDHIRVVKGRNERFDHIPIISVIERSSQ